MTWWNDVMEYRVIQPTCNVEGHGKRFENTSLVNDQKLQFVIVLVFVI